MKISIRNFILTTAYLLSIGCSISMHAQTAIVSSLWNFDGSLVATVGSALVARGTTSQIFPNSTIDGQTAQVMNFPKTTPSQGYEMQVNVDPNGGVAPVFVNLYTLEVIAKFSQ